MVHSMGTAQGRRWRTGAVALTVAWTAACSNAEVVRPAPTTAAPPVTTSASQEVPLVADVVRRNGGLMSSSDSVLVMEPLNSSTLLSFDVSAVRPDCVEQAGLEIPVDRADVDVAAWVSLENDVAALPDGAYLGSLVIARGSPSVASARAGNVLTWDIAPLMPWNAQRHPGTTALVVVLKPAFTHIDDAAVELGASESGRGATLTVTEEPACTDAPDT